MVLIFPRSYSSTQLSMDTANGVQRIDGGPSRTPRLKKVAWTDWLGNRRRHRERVRLVDGDGGHAAGRLIELNIIENRKLALVVGRHGTISSAGVVAAR